MSETPAKVQCPHCYSEIDARATVCPVCRRDIAMTPTKAKNPAIGGLGLLIMLVGLVLAVAGAGELGILAFLAGAGLLIFALVTGNITFLGR